MDHKVRRVFRAKEANQNYKQECTSFGNGMELYFRLGFNYAIVIRAEITGESAPATIDVEGLKDSKKFFEMIEENIRKVWEFYQDRMKINMKTFHELTKYCILLVNFGKQLIFRN